MKSGRHQTDRTAARILPRTDPVAACSSTEYVVRRVASEEEVDGQQSTVVLLNRLPTQIYVSRPGETSDATWQGIRP